MLRRRVLGLLAASTALVGPARAQDDWAKVADAAKKEGKLVIYTASIGSPSLKAVTKAFEQKYGISVELLEARASEVANGSASSSRPAVSWATSTTTAARPPG